MIPLVHRQMTLRHYGSPAFDAARFKPIQDWNWIKPKGGLWTSPIDSAYGWAQWCRENEFSDLIESFDIEFAGNVLIIDSVDDLTHLGWRARDYMMAPGFESLTDLGVDAVHLTVRGQEETRFSVPLNLYGWDCETVLVMNAKCLSERATAKSADRTAD